MWSLEDIKKINERAADLDESIRAIDEKLKNDEEADGQRLNEDRENLLRKRFNIP